MFGARVAATLLVLLVTPSAGQVLEVSTISAGWWVTNTSNTSHKVRIGTPLTIDMESRHNVLGRAMFRAYKLFFYWLNSERGGVNISGVMHKAELTVVNDRSDVDVTRDATNYLVNQLGIRLLLGPFSSTLTEPVASVANATGAAMVAPASSSNSVFRGRPTIFGVLTPAAKALESGFAAINGRAQSVAYFSEAASFTQAVCSAVPNLAATYNMVFVRSIDLTKAPSDSVAFAAWSASTLPGVVAQLKQDDPDVVVGCTYTDVCRAFLVEAERQQFSPKMNLITSCFNNGVTGNERSFRWVTQPMPWTRTMPLPSDPSESLSPSFGWTASIFADTFYNKYREYPPYQAAAAWGASATMIAAIEKAGSADPAAVAAQLQQLNLHSLFGFVHFDADGQNVADWKTVQLQMNSADPLLVSPVQQAQAGLQDNVPWENRNCTQILPEHSVFGYDALGECGRCPQDQVSTFNATQQRRLCSGCPNGTSFTVTSTDQARCLPICQPGEVADAAGIACVPCPAGTEQTGTRDTGLVCTDCGAGKYSGQAGVTACVSCAPGTVAGSAGMTACTLCPPGTSMPMAGFATCTNCPQGKYANVSGLGDCTLCASGTVAHVEGTAICVECTPGYFSNWGARECEPCPKGTYQSKSRMASCVPESSGTACPFQAMAYPLNAAGFWLQDDKTNVEFCAYNSEACREGELCEAGHTGRQCLTCLPGHSRVTGSCWTCPPQVLNIIVTVLMAIVASLMCIFWGNMAVRSAGKPQDIYLILFKLLLNHVITMTVCYKLFSNVLIMGQLNVDNGQLSQAALSWAAFVLMFLNVSFGSLPSETPVWSISCLVQPSVAAADEALVAELSGATHSEHFAGGLAAARGVVRDLHWETELRFIFFWALWPSLIICISHVWGLYLLERTLRRRREFYTEALEFYRHVSTMRLVNAKKRLLAKKWHKFVQSYFVRIWGIWWPVQYLWLFLSKNRPRGLWLRMFVQESRPISTGVSFLMYGSVCRGIIRVLNCIYLGENGSNDRKLVQAVSADLECTPTDGLLWVSFGVGLLWFIVIPLAFFWKVWQVHESLHEESVQRQWGLMVNGYKWNRWGWEFIIFLRKALCFIVEIVPSSEDTRIFMLLCLAMTFSVLHLIGDPYDTRCNGIFDRLEWYQLALWVGCCLGANLMHSSLVSDSVGSLSVVFIIIPTIIAILHIAYVFTVLYQICANLTASVVVELDLRQLDQKQGTLQKVLKWLHERNKKAKCAEPYVAMDHFYGWVSVCGSRGDVAIAPYIPRGRDALPFLDHRPMLSQAPPVPQRLDDFNVENAGFWQRLELLRNIMLTVEFIAGSNDAGPAFSVSLIDFVVRAAFVLARQRATKLDHGTSSSSAKEVDRQVLAQANFLSDPTKLVEGQAEDNDGEDEDFEATGKQMEEDLHKTKAVFPPFSRSFGGSGGGGGTGSAASPNWMWPFSKLTGGETAARRTPGAAEAAAAATGGAEKGNGSAQETAEEVQQGELDEREKLQELLRERYSVLVYEMFSPSTFRRGLPFQDFLLALLELQVLTREKLTVWIDIFERQWLQEQVSSKHDIMRAAGDLTEVTTQSEPQAQPELELVHAQVLAQPLPDPDGNIGPCDVDCQTDLSYLAARHGRELPTVFTSSTVLKWLRLVVMAGGGVPTLRIRRLHDSMKDRSIRARAELEAQLAMQQEWRQEEEKKRRAAEKEMANFSAFS